jgi:hypothetical protein
MANDAFITCPLCHGHSEVRRSELIALLTDRSLPEQAQKYLAELLDAEANLTGVSANGPRDFEKDVHSWNPQLPMWRRSPKE